MQPVFEKISDHQFLHAEGPVWDHRSQSICCVDIERCQVHEFSSAGAHRTITLPEMVGAIAVCEDDNFIAAMQHGFAIINREAGAMTRAGDPEANLPNQRFNDGKCDPAGRFVAGTMSLTQKRRTSSLYILDHNLKFRKLLDKLSVSNGLAWSPDHKKFYLIDTPTFQVSCFNYEFTTGDISDRRIVIKLAEADGFPDGMTIDTDGNLWIAHFGGSKITRWDPRTGEKLLDLDVPATQVSSCTFGGADLKDLYITTSKLNLSADDIAKQPFAGSLLVWRNCGFQGLPAFEFKNATS